VYARIREQEETKEREKVCERKMESNKENIKT